MTTPSTPIAGADPSLLRRLLNSVSHWLVSPAQSLTGGQDRRQARLLAATVFSLLALAVIGSIFSLARGMDIFLQDPFTPMLGAAILLLAVAYTLSRTVWYSRAAWIAVGVLFGLPFALATARLESDTTSLTSLFGWSIFALLVAGVFLPRRGIVGLILANILALVAFSILAPQFPFSQLIQPLGLLLTASAVILVAARHRGQVEHERSATLVEKNIELESLKSGLESRLQSHTTSLEKRLHQLRIAADISRSTSAILNLDDLFRQIVHQIKDGFELYYVGVFLLDGEKRQAVLKAGTGTSGTKMVAEGHRLEVGGNSMIGWATAHKKARIAQDVGEDKVHFRNPHLPLTRSELALPILLGDQVLGALTIQAPELHAFDEADLTILQGIADGLATAINNARLFEKVQDTLEELNTLHQSYFSRAWTTGHDLEKEISLSIELPDQEGLIPSVPLTGLDFPLSLRDQVIGQLTLETSKPQWSAEEVAFIEAVTTQAAIALENARLLEETHQRAERERIVSDITGKLWATTDLETMLRTSLREICRLLDASEGLIQLGVPDQVETQDS